MSTIKQIQALVRYGLYYLTEHADDEAMDDDLTIYDNQATAGFWDGEECEYCGGPIVDKQVTIHRSSEGAYILFEHVPAGVCKECGTHYYAANILKRIEESVHGQQKAEREVLAPVYPI